MSAADGTLPPGQRERADFPRFGLGAFAERFPADPDRLALRIGGMVGTQAVVTRLDEKAERITQSSDFHCVTGWSVRDLEWSGVRFADFHRRHVVPQCRPAEKCGWVIFKGGDGYRAIMRLDDLLAGDVVLADRLDGEALRVEHGAPLRLIAPAHYGYKNVKHLIAIEYWPDRSRHRFARPYPRFMEHPRARVKHEERAIGLPPGPLLRFYRLLVPMTVRHSARALASYRARKP